MENQTKKKGTFLRPHSPFERCRQVRRRANCRCLSLRPLLLEGLGETNDLLRDEHQLLRAFLQFIEQCHCLFLGKVYTQFLDDLVVVIAHGAVLRMKRREFGVIIEQCLVRFYHAKRLREDAGLDENRAGIDTRLVVHGEKFKPFLVIETHHDAVRLPCLLGVLAPLGAVIAAPVFIFFFHISVD